MKRTADNQLTKDSREDEDESVEGESTWTKAPSEVIAQRRIVKVRRPGMPAESDTSADKPAAANPFANFSFTAPVPAATVAAPAADTGSAPTEKKEETSQNDTKKDAEPVPSASSSSLFSSFSFPSAPVSFASLAAKTGSSLTGFAFGSSPAFSPSANPFASSSLSAFPSTTLGSQTSGKEEEGSGDEVAPPSPEPAVPVNYANIVTGEEDEERVYHCDAKLFKFVKNGEELSWQERGQGQLRINKSKDGKKARLLMRMKNAHHVLLNAAVFPRMLTEKLRKKGVRITVMEDNALASYMFMVANTELQEELLGALESVKKDISGETKASA